MRIRPLVIVAALSLQGSLLAGCAATVPSVQVTRFHLDRVFTPGTFALASSNAGLEHHLYENAVTRELVRLGFASAVSNVTRYAVAVDVVRDVREARPRHSPVTIGIGGGTGGYGSGVGLGASFGLGGHGVNQTVVTRLAVRISERSDGTTVWEGRAELQAPVGGSASQPGVAADKLASALFRDFPGTSGRTISVP